MRTKLSRLITFLLVLLLVFSVATTIADDTDSDPDSNENTSEETASSTDEVESSSDNEFIDWSQYSYEQLLAIRDNLNNYILEAERQYAIENGNRVITLNESEITVYKAKTATLTPEVRRVVEDAPEKTTFVWKSSDETVAKVTNKGVVSGVGYGDATITCTASDDEYIFAEAIVHVVLPVTGISLNSSAETLLLSDQNKDSASASLTCTITPENAFNKDIVWTSSNPNIVSVDENGTIQAVSPGSATITVTSSDPGTTAKPVTCKVTVLQAVSKITLAEYSQELNINSTTDIKASIYPENASNKNLVWESSNPKVATVTNTGRVKAIAPGTAKITCRATDGSNSNAVFTVKCIRLISSIKITNSGKAITVNKNSSITVSTVISPSDASNKTLSWSSSNPTIASVNSRGVVTANKGGSAIITCTANDGSGKTASIEIYVPSIAVNRAEYSVVSMSGLDITLKYYGNASDFSYTVSPSNICDISKRQNGETITLSIMPNKAGTATVTLQDKSDRRSDTIITIKVEHSACYDSTSYPVGKYSDVLRYPSAYKGQKMSVYGRVLQISTGWFSTVMRVATKGRYDDVFYIKCDNDLVKGIIEDDYISIYGICTGSETYTTILGASITIPSMEAEKIFIGKH